MSSVQKRAKQRKIPEFITKLADMIEKYPNFINWDLDGKHVHIFNSHLLESELLSKYFRHTNLSSFIRQLNIYGFRKMDQDLSYIKFQHQIFRRGQQTEYWKIKRKVNECKQKQEAKQPIEGKMEQIKQLQKFGVVSEIIQFISQQYKKKIKLENIYEELEKDFVSLYQLLQFDQSQKDCFDKEKSLDKDQIYESSFDSNDQVHYFRREHEKIFTKVYEEAKGLDHLLKRLCNQASEQANNMLDDNGLLSELNINISSIELNIKNIDEDNSIFNFENCQN